MIAGRPCNYSKNIILQLHYKNVHFSFPTYLLAIPEGKLCVSIQVVLSGVDSISGVDFRAKNKKKSSYKHKTAVSYTHLDVYKRQIEKGVYCNRCFSN